MEKEVSFIPLIIYLVNIVMAPGAWQKTNTRKQELSALGSCLSHEGLWAVSKHWIINPLPPGRTPQIAASRLLWTPYATTGDCSTGSLRCLKTRRRADGMGCERQWVSSEERSRKNRNKENPSRSSWACGFLTDNWAFGIKHILNSWQRKCFTYCNLALIFL